ncbi:PspC domain-containing protein [Suipraeoptans intestinalis]|uniref:PspC domain-containing protein n=1 Tax=Suipraeoptans intestinalis TaxID=2606628 RepID=UPI0023EF7655|nr:PspC domain-containing protein [Suipraeoptans intestinalis]MDD7769817.1 PspC domain-containing protein [Suipraeoptans intestinalis]MDY3120957.1 PspC domain-containing protein [Suipraeoptans intestinalis]
MMEKRLYRSKNNKMICGVCGGIAEYFNVDPTLVRLGVVLLGFGGGIGLFTYLIAAVIMPENPGNQNNY